MTPFQLWLIFGVPFLLTGLLYIAVVKSGGKRCVLLLVAASYLVVVVIGPIWLCILYFSSDEAWYGIAVTLVFRALELTAFQVGKGFNKAWKAGNQ
jgi:hypothetical protein